MATVGSSNAGVSPEMVQSQACLKATSEALCKSLSTGCKWDTEGKTCASSLTAGMSGAGVFFLLAFIAFVLIASVFYVRNPAEFAHHRSVAMARLRQWAGKDAKAPIGSSHARRNNQNNNNAGRPGVQLPAAAGGVGAAGMSGGGGGLRGQGTPAAGVTAAGVTAAGVRVQMKQPRVGTLPNNWEAIYDEASDDTYFYHAPTGRTQWDRPAMPRVGGPKPPPRKPKAAATQLSDLPPGWEAAVEKESGDTYWFHVTTGATTWEKPQFGKYGTSDQI